MPGILQSTIDLYSKPLEIPACSESTIEAHNIYPVTKENFKKELSTFKRLITENIDHMNKDYYIDGESYDRKFGKGVVLGETQKFWNSLCMFANKEDLVSIEFILFDKAVELAILMKNRVALGEVMKDLKLVTEIYKIIFSADIEASFADRLNNEVERRDELHKDVDVEEIYYSPDTPTEKLKPAAHYASFFQPQEA